jgi:DNA-directed RNA polymerase specialized sigma24 family protein
VRAEHQAESRASGRTHYGGQPVDGRVSVRGITYESPEFMAIFRQVDEELSKLPEKKRECWSLFHDWGYSYKEIAEIMGLSFEEVKTNIRAVDRHLKRKFR